MQLKTKLCGGVHPILIIRASYPMSTGVMRSGRESMSGETSSRPTIAGFEILWEWDGYQRYAFSSVIHPSNAGHFRWFLIIFNFYIIKKSHFKNFSRPTSLGNCDQIGWLGGWLAASWSTSRTPWRPNILLSLLIDWLSDWFAETDCLIGWMVESLTGRPRVWLTCWLRLWLNGC
jgi:hypothetical protein